MPLAALPRRRLATFGQAVFFVLGFSLVFILGWGGAATVLGQAFGEHKRILGTLGGVVVILFGLHTLGLLNIPWLAYDLRLRFLPSAGGAGPSALMGISFAAGWSPCIGPTLGSILTLGLSQENAGAAMILSSGYAFGLGLPFLAIGLMAGRATLIVRRLTRYARPLQLLSGTVLVSVGVLMVTNQLTWIAVWAQRSGIYLDVSGRSGLPTYPIAVFAGLLSFLSPCVLPLVPGYVGYLARGAAGQP